MPARKTPEQGFSLIEVLIAIFILAIGILAVVSMQTAAMHGNFKAVGLTEASIFAEDRMERILAQDYDSIGSGQQTVGGRYGATWTVQNDTPVANTKTVAVTVAWEDMGVSRNVSMRQIVARVR